MVSAAPYREGRHYATTPGQFVPIIEALEKLHRDGFVHGDIRGFNTVFSDVKGEGWLIDFDFGEKEGKETTVYPRGYNKLLIGKR
jgi:RIO-like serine/threonine protein kinase